MAEEVHLIQKVPKVQLIRRRSGIEITINSDDPMEAAQLMDLAVQSVLRHGLTGYWIKPDGTSGKSKAPGPASREQVEAYIKEAIAMRKAREAKKPK